MTFVKKPKTSASSAVKQIPSTAPVRQPVKIDPVQQRRQVIQQQLQCFTARPLVAQKQALQPVMTATQLHREETEQFHQRQTSLQRKSEELTSQLPSHAVEQALQRQQAQASSALPPRQPQTTGEWVTVMRQQAEQAEGRTMNSREAMNFTALQRQIAQTIVQRFRQDRQLPEVRYAEYGGHLATLQRHPLSSHVARGVMSMIPQGERPALQRAVDEVMQRETAQRMQDERALELHSLQRQLTELQHEASQPVFERIQARRGTGAPLPEAIQRHLEQGLNHDLSAVRIHDDAEADKLARKVNAIAFTSGQDVYFQSGKFDPNTQTGLELLAHEITHTVQQARGEVGPGVDPSASHETQARDMGRRLSLRPASSSGPAGARPVPAVRGKATRNASGALQRKAKEPESSVVQAVNKTKGLIQSGKIDAAVQGVKKLPSDQRDLVIGVLSTMRLPAWESFKTGLHRAQVHSPSIDLCLAGPVLYNPLNPTSPSPLEASLAVAGRYAAMPLSIKLEKAIAQAPLSEAFRKQLLSMVSVSALAGAAAIFIALQLTPEGWVLDAAIVVIALATYGPAAFTIGEHLGAFFRTADRATSEQDLKIAGNHFAQAVAILGTAGLAGLIGKAIGKAGGKGVVKQQDKSLGRPTTAQQALPAWKTQYDAAIKQGLNPKQASLSATMKVQAPTTKPVQPSSSMNAVYEGSRVANQELIPLTQTLARRYDVKFQTRDGLKDVTRSTEKVNSDYGGNAGQLLDVSGSRLLFNKLDDVYSALAYIRSKYNVVQIKDRFVEPQASGYRDIVLNIRASNGYVVELRLEITKMSNFAALEHQWYKERRTIEGLLKRENRPPTPQEKARLEELKKLAEGGYTTVWEEIKKVSK